MTPRKRKLPYALLFALVIGAYSAYQARGIILGPSITLASPLPFTTVQAAETVTGTARNVASISMNGFPITVDESGRFKERLVMPTGSSILTLAVTDRFGRTEETRITVFRDGTEPAATRNVPTLAEATSSEATTTESLP